MSLPTPFTDRFMAGWDPDSIAPQMLVRVELLEPTPLTLYWCVSKVAGASPLVTNPGGFTWQPVIVDGDPIHAPGSLFDPGPSLVVTGFRIANVRLIPQSSGTAADLFSDYVMRGAAVTMWLWHAGISDFALDAPQVFKGVIQSASVGPDVISIRCQQRKDTNVSVPPNKVSKSSHPNAPASSLGVPRPLVYGQFVNDGMDDPWSEPYPDTTTPYAKLGQEDVGAAGLVIPGVMVDSGVGGADGKVIFADHALMLIGNTTGQPNVKVAAGDALASLNGTAIATALLGDLSGVELKDEENVAYVGVPCIDVRLSGAFPNLALNPRAAMDIFDETTYAIVQSTGGATRLALIPGNVGSPGKMISAEMVIGYRTSHTTTPAKVRYNRPASDSSFPADIALTAHTTAAVGEAVIERVPLISGDIFSDPNNVYAAGTVSSDWNTGAGDILVFLNPATAGHWIHPIFVGLVIKYQPSQSLVAGEISVMLPATLGGLKSLTRRPPGVPITLTRDGIKLTTAPSVYEAQGQFFVNAHGREDTTGDYTGEAAALIERPMDMIQHLLEVYGGESAANIETAINRFGSFARARMRNVSIEGNPISLGVHVGQTTQLHPLLARIAQQAPGWLYLSRFDDRWKFVPWDRKAPAADFPRTLEAADILEGGLDAELYSESNIVNDVSVQYAYDFFRNRTMHTTHVNGGSSDGGFASRGKRDQLLLVETTGAGQNNKLDIVRSAVTYAATLLGATYTPAQMMVEVKRALVALAVAGAQWNVAHGGTIVTGHNDRIDFVDIGGTHLAVIPTGLWTVGEMPYKIQIAMRAVADASVDVRVGLGMYVLAGVNDALDFNDGVQKRVTLPPGWYRNGAHLAKTVQDLLNSQSSNWTCTFNTGTLKFTIARSAGTAWLLWLSGSGAAANCAPLLGYDHAADDTGSSSYVGNYARTRAHIHVQGKSNVQLLWNTGANKANSAAVSMGYDQSVDIGGNNTEGGFAIQDETFAIGEATNFSLKWQSGANTATSAAHLLGWKNASDDGDAKRHLADRRRSNRETTCATSAARYGPKESENLTAIDVRTTEAALNLRDTPIDVLAEPPIPLKVKTHRFPDLERGRIVEVGDLSALVTKPPRYGAGSWAGKKFRAVEVAQHWGRSWHQEIVFLEEQNALASLGATVPDGITAAAPAFVAWSDGRAATHQSYAQKVDVDLGSASWTVNGVPLSANTSGTATSTREAVFAMPDGGLIALYEETIAGVNKLMAQRLSVTGAKLWGAGGVEVDSADPVVSSLRIVSDGVGGVFFVWMIAASETIYVRRYDGDGNPAWAKVEIGDATGDDRFQTLNAHPDGLGGVYLAWSKELVGATSLWGQRVDSTGTELWAAAGVNLGVSGLYDASLRRYVATAVDSGNLYAMISSGHASASTTVVVTKRAPANGAATWSTGDLDVSGTSFPVLSFMIVPSIGGNVFAIWFDDRSPTEVVGRAQLLNSAGVSQWTSPLSFCTRARGSNFPPQYAIPDGSGDVILIFQDPANDPSDIYAVKITRAGAVAWGPVKIADLTNDLDLESICSDTYGGAIVFYREDTTADVLRAVRVTSLGALPWGLNGIAITSGLTGVRFPCDCSSAAT